MSKEDILQKLREVTELRSWRTSWFYSSKLFYGQFYADEFRIRPAFGFPYNNYMIPVIKGLFESKDNKVILWIKMEKPHGPDMVRFFFFLFTMLILPILILVPAIVWKWHRGIVFTVESLSLVASFIAFGIIISNSYEMAKRRLCTVLGLRMEPERMKWE